jgi:hypothetical protein
VGRPHAHTPRAVELAAVAGGRAARQCACSAGVVGAARPGAAARRGACQHPDRAALALEPKAKESAVEPVADRVLLAASAPALVLGRGRVHRRARRLCRASNARRRLKKLADLGEAGNRRVDDVAAGAWRTGAPVTVRLAGEGATVTTRRGRFE